MGCPKPGILRRAARLRATAASASSPSCASLGSATLFNAPIASFMKLALTSTVPRKRLPAPNRPAAPPPSSDSGHRALKRFGRAMQGQPRRQRTGRQPVVDRCDKGVVDHPAHLLIGEIAQN